MAKNFCVILLLCFSAGAFAQKSALQFYTVKLPDKSPVHNIRFAQRDEAGLLWFVSGNGLYRFDGNHLLQFNLESEPALPSFPVTAFRADQQGNLWLGFRNGAARFDLRKWTITSLYADDWSEDQPRDKHILSINYASDGKVYFGTRTGKLYVFGGGELKLALDMRDTHLDAGSFSAILTIQEPSPGQLWLSTGNGMLVSLPVAEEGYGAASYFKVAELNGEAISRMCFGPEGKCLLSVRSDGIFLADTRELLKHWPKDSLRLDGPARKGYVKRVILPEGENGNIYSPFYIAGAEKGFGEASSAETASAAKVAVLVEHAEYSKKIYTYDFQEGQWKNETPAHAVSFPGNKIHALSGSPMSTYVCSGGGLTSLEFRKLPLASLLAGFDNANSIRTVYKSPEGKLYVSSYRDRFIRYNERTGEAARLTKMYVYSILPWSSDTLLLGTEGDGLQWYLPMEDRFVPVTIDESGLMLKDQIQSHYVTALCRVNDTLVWAGTYQGVYLINPERGRVYPVFRDSLAVRLLSAKVYAIMRKSAASYLMATTAGLFAANPETGRVKYFLAEEGRDSLRNTEVYCLLETGGKVWMGTNGRGLLVSDGQGRLINRGWLRGKLSGKMVYSLVKAGDFLLAGTENGLNVIHLPDSSVTTYSVYNGLPAGEFNHSAIFSNGKEAYLGTINGLVHWQIAARSGVRTEPAEGKACITRMLLVDKNNVKKHIYRLPYLLSDSAAITVPPGTKYFSLGFGPAGGAERLLELSYRLSTEDNWNEIGSQREITFVRTKPGSYQLELAARTPDGRWIPGLLTIPVLVKPAFHQTAAFKFLLMLIPVLVVILLFRYRETQLRKERRLRMKIAGDLHDEVGSALTRIWHQASSHVPEPASAGATAANPSPAAASSSAVADLPAVAAPVIAAAGSGAGETRHLQAISETSREALAMMSDIVWSIDARFDTLEDLVIRMKDYVYKLQDDLDMPLKFTVEGQFENKKVSQIVRQNLFLLFKEAINNAIKHGSGEEITIHMNIGEQITLQVTNSCRIDAGRYPRIVQGGRGLQNMRRRATNMHGLLKTVQVGAEFRVTVQV